jgi:glycosyltransferase involved in cell wall biosynthesis
VSLRIRHLLPGLGAVPLSPETDGVSGLVGASLGIAGAQAASGHRVEVVGWRPSGGPRAWQLDGVKVRSTSGWPWACVGGLDLRLIGPLLVKASASRTADVLHVFSEPHLLLARRARARVLHYQTPLPVRPPRLSGVLHAQADAIVFCSHYLRRRFHEAVTYPAERTFVVHNGVMLTRFRRLCADTERRRWGIAPEDSIILYVGAVVPEKGLPDLVAAVRDLGDAGRPHLVIAGGSGLWQLPDAPSALTRSPYEVELRRSTERLPQVTWLGVVPSARMPGVFAMADVCVCPSRWPEPLGTVNVEAMAAGKPVVASRVGGIPEVVEDGITGFLVPPVDRKALTSALSRLLNDEDLRRRMGGAARRRSVEFGWDRAARSLDAIYEQILNSESGARRIQEKPSPG